MTTKQTITGFSLHEFLQKAQALIQEGFVFDFESNENFPSRFGNVYECTMLPAATVETTESETAQTAQTPVVDAPAETQAAEVPAVETPAQRKRKAA